MSKNAILRKAGLSGWPLAGSEIMVVGMSPHQKLIDRPKSLCQTVSENNTVYDEHLLYFWESGIWYMVNRWCLCDQLPVKTMGVYSLMSCPG